VLIERLEQAVVSGGGVSERIDTEVHVFGDSDLGMNIVQLRQYRVNLIGGERVLMTCSPKRSIDDGKVVESEMGI